MAAKSTLAVALRERALPYFGFAADGVGFALPGALMPWLLAHWLLRDDQAGVFLFLFSIGTLTGALFARGNLLRRIVAGALCTSAGAMLLAHTSRGGTSAACAFMFLYGVGLGILLTSISLLQSRRWVEEYETAAREAGSPPEFFAYIAFVAAYCLSSTGVIAA